MESKATIGSSIDDIAYYLGGGESSRRKPEDYGDIALSVQVGPHCYCSPKTAGLPIEEYESVEVGFLDANRSLSYPSKCGIVGFDELFEDGMASPVAPNVSQEDLERLREACRVRAAGTK